VISTKEEWHALTSYDQKALIRGFNTLSPEEQKIVRAEVEKEQVAAQKLDDIREEGKRFVEMNQIVRAEQGKKYEPTEQARHMVKKMAAFGFTLEQIADVIRVGVSSLQKHFKNELETGHVEANYMVADKLFRMAMDGDTAAAIFWCETRLGWKTIARHEHAFDAKGVDQPGINKLSEGDLETLHSILRKAKSGERRALPAA
jgi:hypothetical protein